MLAVKSVIAVRVCGGSELAEYGTVFLNRKPSLKKENISKCLQDATSSDSNCYQEWLTFLGFQTNSQPGTKQNMYFQLEKLLP